MGTTVAQRVAVHRALGDEHRLAMVDALWLSDRTPTELGGLTGLGSNLLAFHLDVLEQAELIDRHRSQGDGRRRYVALRPEQLPYCSIPSTFIRAPGPVLFVCSHNAARSQLAAAMWTATTGEPSLSAGTDPADVVHPMAVRVARAHGLDLGPAPRSYADVDVEPGLVVSVCDRARESSLPFEAPLLHWSIPDPVGSPPGDFDRAFVAIEERIGRLAGMVAA